MHDSAEEDSWIPYFDSFLLSNPEPIKSLNTF